MTIRIEVPEGEDALREFIAFHDEVYRDREVFWPAEPEFQLPMLTGESPFARGRRVRPFLARDGSRILARALAAIDDRYQRHWKERLGHLVWFEAMPESRAAVRLLAETACEWLAQQGAEAARTGFSNGLFDFPFVIDDYESLPPSIMRQNPAGYHVLLKDAGFETEKGFVDYKLEVRPELVERWQSALEAARRSGFEIVPLRDVPEKQRVADYGLTWGESFRNHWGWIPFSEDEITLMFEAFAPVGMLDVSVLAYRDGEPVGMLALTPEHSADARRKPGRELADSEKLDVLGIGVRDAARGRGVNLAMAGYGFLELVKRGAKYLSYTLVLDDNWPSRRTGEKLGAWVCANYVAYRRNFRR